MAARKKSRKKNESAATILMEFESSHGWDETRVRDIIVAFIDDEGLIAKFRDHCEAYAESDDMHAFD